MLDVIPDDCIRYLCSLDHIYIINLQPLFLTCKKIYVISNRYFNDIINRDYKLLIQDNHIEYPKNAYLSMYKIYGNKIVIDISKLHYLMILIISTNNIELIMILYKTMLNSIKLLNFSDLIKHSLKSSEVLSYLLTQSPLLSIFQVMTIVDYYDQNKINSIENIKNVMNKYDYHKNSVIINYLLHKNLKMFKLFIDYENCNEWLAKTICIDNKEAVKYIMTTFKYDTKKVYSILSENYPYNKDKIYEFLALDQAMND